MKRVRFLLFSVVATLFGLCVTMACSDNDTDEESTESAVWYEVQSEDTYNIVELAAQIPADMLSKSTAETPSVDDLVAAAKLQADSANIYLRSVILHYKSIDAENNPIVLSGRLVLRAVSKEVGSALVNPKDIVLSSHISICADWKCPSRAMPVDALLAVRNEMVVCPDYLGYGATRDKAHPYICADLTSRNCVDMAKASLQYLKDKGASMQKGYGLYNIGYSQGGAAALAIQKYIEQHPALDSLLPLKATHCGGGPYDMIATLESYQNGMTLERPFFYPLAVIGMKTGFPNIMKDVELEDFFSDKFLKAGILEMVEEKELTENQIDEKIFEAIGSDNFQDLISDKMKDSNSQVYQSLMKALKANDLISGWKPQNKVIFYHSKADHVVPYINMVEAVNSLCNDNVYWVSSESQQHVNYGIFFYAWGLAGNFLNTESSFYNKATETCPTLN